MTTKKKRLLIVNRSQAPYYRALYTCLASSLGEGWDVVLQTMDKHWDGYDGHAFRRDLVIPAGVTVTEVQTRLAPKVGALPKTEMAKELREFEPDVVMMHETSLFNIHAMRYVRSGRAKLVVSTEIGRLNSHDPFFPWHARLVRRWIAPTVEGIVAHSPGAMDTDLGVPDERIARAFHAYESESTSPRSTDGVGDEIRLVFLGQIIERKGLDLLLESLALAAERGIAVRLAVIGGDTEGLLEAEVSKWKLEDRVDCLGFLEGEEIEAVMRESEVFVLPTRYDTYGAVTQEAARFGLALLISKNAGSSELVSEGENGFVFDPEDTEGCVEILAKLADPELRRSMMKAGRLTAEEYGAERSAASVAELLESLLA